MRILKYFFIIFIFILCFSYANEKHEIAKSLDELKSIDKLNLEKINLKKVFSKNYTKDFEQEIYTENDSLKKIEKKIKPKDPTCFKHTSIELDDEISIDKIKNIQEKKTKKQMSYPLLKGIILLSPKANLDKIDDKKIIGLKTCKINLPGKIKNLQEKIKFNFPINEKNIEYIKCQIYKFYKKNNRPFINIEIPDQDLSNGVLKIIIAESKIDKIIIKGNKWFKTDKFKKEISLKKNDFINLANINSDLHFINTNPFINANAIFMPGTSNQTTEIEILIKDKRPFRSYTGIDNTGTHQTGNNRFFAGFNIGNLFSIGQMLNYQYTSDTNFKRFMSHLINYVIPLPWKHNLTFLGGYSYTKGKIHHPDAKDSFDNDGFGLQTSMRYDIFLKPKNSFLQEATFGLDFKRTNNNLQLGGVPIFARYANLTQMMISYNLGFRNKKIITSFEIEGFYSPGRIVADQTNKIYNELRTFAKNKYFYSRFSFSYLWNVYKDFSINAFLRGQVSTRNLLYSEEYYLGGYDTVRGYKERVINVDNAFVTNLELQLPSFSLTKIFQNKTGNDKLNFLGFYDFGWGSRHKKANNENKKSLSIYSVGIGTRYNIIPYLICRADLGFSLKSIKKENIKRPNRLHFSITASY